MRDYYSPMAEFYEMVAARQIADSGPPLTAALAGLDPAAGPIVEIGAGTGRVTEVIAAAVPGGRILAAEPSVLMRAVLTSRIAARPELRPLVTVVDGAAPDLELPDVIGAAVVFGVAGHLPPEQRRLLWRRIRERLAPKGVIVVELMGAHTPRIIPPVRQIHDRIGRQTYEWWVSGEPGGPGLMRFTTTWRVHGPDGRLVREVGDSYDWYTLDTDLLAREAEMVGRRTSRVGGAGSLEIVVLSSSRTAPTRRRKNDDDGRDTDVR
ncbi:class I SAM-dependent methyltransferase [Protofrankia symbiont of Coriaria ruscifolia]|uniref:class I SAM-dependent methyltransferase n=1 Tax=Protofrankia symbiont of Coriaria ruscifolia TaxID=1306542 RepID=UPI001041AD62|nr:class I SAM-dependent methyltransferase [Protofrankia symbiont of Coriaria ruscifolia]